MEPASSLNDLQEFPTVSDNRKINENTEEPSEWNKCIELLDRKKETDDKISQQVTLVANLGKAFDEGIQQNEGEEQREEKEEVEEEEEKESVAHSQQTPTHSEFEFGMDSKRKHSSARHQQTNPKNNANSTRARRSKRLYSPSPPPSLIGETNRKKKKEKSVDEVGDFSLGSLSNAPSSSLLKWAKVPPSSSSLSSSLDSNGMTAVIHDNQSQTSKESSNKKYSAKEKLNASIALTKMEADQIGKSIGSDQSNIQLIRQNEKLTRENVQLKQRNQEQQQQIQALIGANRELIWAFNESRREHDELMQQLRVMAKLVNNGNSTRTAGVENAGETLQFEQQKAKSVRPKQIAKKNATTASAAASSGGGGGGRQRKKQCTGMVYVAQEQLPPSLAILKKKPTTSAPFPISPSAPSEDSDQQPTAFDPTPNEQMRDRVKKDIIEAVERRQNANSLANRDEEVDKIKNHLSKMAPDPNLNKLIGSRKPFFYTPKEFGDWRSVISSVLRKQYVLQLFEALCPEFTGSNVVDLAVKNPSRADFIQKSLNFVFDAENELFVSSTSRDSYFMAIAEKIFTLREAKDRQNLEKSRQNGTTERIGDAVRRRTLADVLKPKHTKSADEHILEGDEI
ncbi:hypothetical protein niasHT_039666 [Heterodera trifolii]|uniref:Uncharacterized protein n=1 Tax=Heterodera trifolii TaxID=157864 RepID=A0ABD2IHB6_9BILA